MTLRWLLVYLLVATAANANPAALVANPEFEHGGYTYADHWRPLPGLFRMLRKTDPRDGHSLYLQLYDDGDGGVMQVIELPPHRTLSLRMLATCWADGNDCVVASLTRVADGVVLSEVRVDGIERGEIGTNFDTGRGGLAELMVRLVGERGARASVEHVVIGAAVAACEVAAPVFGGGDLVLAPGDGLRVDANFTPRTLPEAAAMLAEALEDATGTPASRIAATVAVSVAQPETTDWPARESYHLKVCTSGVTIEAPAEQGAFWAMMTLLDLIRPEPGGGARILAVDVRDQPALPWRVARNLPWRMDADSGARALVRLKLNMAEVRPVPDRDDLATVDALRAVGIEPVISVASRETDVQASLEDAVARLGARYLVVSPASEGENSSDDAQPLDWKNPPLSVAVDFARAHPNVAVMVRASRRGSLVANTTVRAIVGISLPTTFEGWPPSIIALLTGAAENLAERQEQLGSRQIRYLTTNWFADTDGVDAALQARLATDLCLGSVIDPELHDAADLAWRGLPEGTP